MNKPELKDSWLHFLELQGYTHAVTFKPNDPCCAASIEGLHRLFVKVHMLVDRRLLGPRFAQVNRAGLRSHAIGVVEGLPDSGHLHGAFRIAASNWAKFESLFADGTTHGSRTGIWRTLLPHGSCAVEPIYAASGWHSYEFKHVWQTDDTDRVVFLPLPVA